MSAVIDSQRVREMGAKRPRSGFSFLRIVAAVACWTVLLLTVLITTIGIGWTLLGVVLVGPVSAGFPQKAPVLLALNVGLAVLTARAFASARAVGAHLLPGIWTGARSLGLIRPDTEGIVRVASVVVAVVLAVGMSAVPVAVLLGVLT